MPDYSNFPPESTDNTPLVYYFPSYYSLQETVTSAKLNSLIRCYNILVEKFMQHNHTGGVNANNENTRAVKLAACACLVDESIFTQCLAHECVTNDKIYDLSYRKVFLSNEPGNEYTLPQKINDMDTDIANRVHLSIDNDIYANNKFYGENIFLSNILFTSDINDLNEHTFDNASIIINQDTIVNSSIIFNYNVTLNGNNVVSGSLQVPTVDTSSSDTNAASTRLVDNKIQEAITGLTTASGQVGFISRISGSNREWTTKNSIATNAIKIKIGDTDYYVPATTTNGGVISVGNCHGSCHGNCHGHCAGMKGVGI